MSAGISAPSNSSRRPRILVVGSANTDMVIKVDRLPKPGETVLGGRFASASGGKGANQAVSAARAGGAVTLIGRVGKDAFGDKLLAGLEADAVDVDYVVRDPNAPSGAALIFVDRNGENSIAVASGANDNLAPVDLHEAKDAFRRAEIVVLQLETPLSTVEAAVRIAAEAGVPILLNPAPARPLPPELLKKIHLLTPNESEAKLLTGLPVGDSAEAERAAEAVLERGVKNVILTLGARGAYVAGGDIRRWISPFKVAALDATAAGDVFNGTLAVALAEGKDLIDAAEFATAAAAIAVTRLGAQTSIPSREEIETMLQTGKIERTLTGRAP